MVKQVFLVFVFLLDSQRCDGLNPGSTRVPRILALHWKNGMEANAMVGEVATYLNK